MELVDTHCHIQSAGLDAGERTTRELWQKGAKTPDAMIAAADTQGVTRRICVGCDLEDSEMAVSFVAEREGCWASIGIHPHEAKLYHGQTSALERFAGLATQSKVVAVGECGFDFFYNHSPVAAQEAMLRFQIELALAHDLPLIFHVREAFDRFWPVFDSYQGVRGVLHSFTDTAANLEKALERDLYIGVNGIATFTKDPAQQAVYRAVPLEKLLLETDAPFLTPKPHRGTINEPKQVGVIADYIAADRGVDRNVLADATTANARALFRI